jgi:CheY-specific phosphatase CheX
MSIFEIIQSDPDLVRLIQEAVFNTLKVYACSDIHIKPLFTKEHKSSFEVNIIGMLRLTSKEGEDLLAIGFSELAFMTLYQNMFNEQQAAISSDNKDLAGELINIIFQTIDPELRKKGYNCEVSLPEVLMGADLEKWSHTLVKESLVLPFATANGDLFFEIPDLRK